MRISQFAIFALALGHAAAHLSTDPSIDVPRFILQKGHWICVDRNPQQLKRQDCWPHASTRKSGEIGEQAYPVGQVTRRAR
jgi:hypothetical protein